MKIIIKNIAFLLAGLLLVTSCEWEPVMFDDSKSHVAFNTQGTSIPEQGDAMGIVVRVTALTDAPSVTVDFEFDTTDIDPASAAFEGTDFNLINDSKTLSFPNGWGFDTIWIDPVDNDIFTGDKVFNIALTSNSEDYQFGETQSQLVILADNEHPLGAWIGTYTVDAASYGNPGAWDETWSVVTTSDPDDVNNLLITISLDAAGSPFAAKIDKEAMTIEIAAGTDAGNMYGYGSTYMYVGDFATLDTDSPVIGTIKEDGTIEIDELAMYLPDYEYYWDAFNTTWTKTAKKAAASGNVLKEKADRIR